MPESERRGQKDSK